MRGAPDYNGWAAGLIALSSEPELACVRKTLEALASNGLQNLDPLNNSVREHSSSFQFEDLWRASERIEQGIAEESHSALLAATVVLALWSNAAGKRLYDQSDDMPEPGWAQFPYVCAKAALRAGAVNEALGLIDRSLDALVATKYKYKFPRYQAALGRYRNLGVSAETRRGLAIENLAGDLRDSCRAEQPNFRAEMGALLWTLGMIPESGLFAPGASLSLPPLRLCRQVITVSDIGMAGDPLTQYVWLEMMGREPFDIRDHPVFFGGLNINYHNNPEDDFANDVGAPGKAPSSLFAKTIIAWFRGDLGKNLARDYLESFEWVVGLVPDKVPWSVYLRMALLSGLVGERFGLLTEEGRTHSVKLAQKLVAQAEHANRIAFFHPSSPQLYTRTTGPIFFLLDKLSVASAPLSEFLSALESFRTADQDYWLIVTPPLPSVPEQEAAAALIEQEKKLLTELRGAYFLILAPILPMHYRKVKYLNESSSLGYPDTSKGIDHYNSILGELRDLYAQMESHAPEYVRRRKAPFADDAGSLAQALGMHRIKKNTAR
jgi:hypothetical protein